MYDLLEKVLDGIEEVRNSGIQCPLENVEPHRCFHFPEKLIDEIVSLLKAQEPHVITEDDFTRCDDYGYIPAVFEPRDMSRFVNWEWSLICDAAFRYGSDKDGRYWSGIPTDEQMEATPWQ